MSPSRLICLIAFMFIICAVCLAQNPKLPPPVDYPLTVKYDRFDDTTSIVLKHTNVQGSTLNGLDMALLAVYKGERLTSPIQEARLSIASVSPEWRFLDGSRTLRAIVDGERVNLGEMERRSGVVGRGYVVEYLGVFVSEQIIAKIAGAKKVEMRLGIIEFELSKETLGYIRDFVNELKPPTDRR